MSAALLEEYNSDNLIQDEKNEVIAQRSHILQTASRKAQERTLTLQETTDLYAKFNRTYESRLNRAAHKEDESWALKLLQDCEEDSLTQTLVTRVNGEPIQKAEADSDTEAEKHIKVGQSEPNEWKNGETPPLFKPTTILTDHSSLITEEEKMTIRDLFIYDQYEQNNKFRKGSRAHKPFLIVMSVSVVLTISGLIGISLFL